MLVVIHQLGQEGSAIYMVALRYAVMLTVIHQLGQEGSA